MNSICSKKSCGRYGGRKPRRPTSTPVSVSPPMVSTNWSVLCPIRSTKPRNPFALATRASLHRVRAAARPSSAVLCRDGSVVAFVPLLVQRQAGHARGDAAEDLVADGRAAGGQLRRGDPLAALHPD